MISVYWRDHELYQHEVFRKASGPPMLRRYVNTQRERKQNSLLSFLFAKRNQYTNWRGDTRLWPLDHQRSSFLFESSKTILPFNNNFGFCIFYKLNMFCIFCIVCIFCIYAAYFAFSAWSTYSAYSVWSLGDNGATNHHHHHPKLQTALAHLEPELKLFEVDDFDDDGDDELSHHYLPNFKQL